LPSCGKLWPTAVVQITADQGLVCHRSVHSDCRSVRNTADQVLLTTDHFTMFVWVCVFIICRCLQV